MAQFKKILIANRGEIACRIIRTARKMDIATVAVYSQADKHALHVQLADEAIEIGAAASSESYLRADRIIEACQQSGAEAVHPGFGFLSENSSFAAALHKANITFIGPGIRAIEVMGDKIESKKLAADAGVSTVPGHPDAIGSPAEALKVANQIGCPVMLKASAGGGGKGMRIAWTPEQVEEGFSSAQNEARNAFGDDRVFVEKYIERPRHIEIQVLADSHGHCVALGERECSIQRRHQKVLEEAPSPFVDAATREAMSEQAVALAQAVDYCSAGTVEFIVDKDRNFYFLEMNTRLQVEHPVTEFVIGLDLVEQMIRIAAGERLELQQKDIRMNGWSLEARVYAEDPDRNFMPSIGRLTRYQPPQEGEIELQSAAGNIDSSHSDIATVRVDTGVFEGGEISMYYDPMIAKLVTHGATREAAVAAMADALDRYVIRGVNHNIAFLSALVNHPSFKRGDLTTGFIDEHYPDGFGNKSGNQSSNESTEAGSDGVNNGNNKAEQKTELDENAFAAVFAQAVEDLRAATIDKQLRRSKAKAPTLTYSVLGKSATGTVESTDIDVIELSAGPDNSPRTFKITDPQASHVLSSGWTPGNLLFEADVRTSSDADNTDSSSRQLIAQVDRSGSNWLVTRNGQANRFAVLRQSVATLQQLMPEKTAPDMSRYLLSPMPGLLMKVSVDEGENVKAGQELAIVEAMKMENVLTAEQDATVKSIKQQAGASLSVDEIIIEFE